MIVLNISKEIIRVENWTDITERPGFTASLDPAKHSLDAIIGKYAFGEKVPCGLSNCHTPHNLGYIVATKDGRETNMGKDCGKTYFGVDFLTLSNKFDRDMTEKDNREKLWAFFFRIDEVAEQVAALRSGERGADWVHRQITLLFDIRHVPPIVVRKVAAMAKNRDPRLIREREAVESEIVQMELAQGRRLPRPQVVEETIGHLAGLEALYPENNLKSMLIEDVAERLKQLNNANIDTLTYEQLGGWSRWLATVEPTLERAAGAVQNGRALLTQENLLPLADATELNNREREVFMKFLRQMSRR